MIIFKARVHYFSLFQAVKSPSSKKMKKMRAVSQKKWQKMENNEKQSNKMNFLEGIFIMFQEVMNGKQDIIKSKPSWFIVGSKNVAFTL